MNDEDRAEEREKALLAALEDLHALQNGPPLPSYEEEWHEVMETLRRLLAEEEQE